MKRTKNGGCVHNELTRAFLALWLCALLVTGTRPPVSAAAPRPGPMPGEGALVSQAEAARFLEQATFGPVFVTDPTDQYFPVSVAHVQAIGFPAWLNEQFNTPLLLPPNLGTNYGNPSDPSACDTGGVCWSPQNRSATCDNTCNRDNYTVYQLQGDFYSNALTGPDQLRQRVAWALTQIDVVSQVDIGPASWMVPYLQVFDRDAFGNFRQLLYDITVNPAMGQYLNMRGNRKGANVNENYAREILQLFSIGLNMLNPDGTVQRDGQGNALPTYGQDTINNFARVFTGWDLAQQIPIGIPNYRDPMIVTNENNHDRDPKTLLSYPNAVNPTLPGGEDAVPELNEALDNIFNHPNVGPFIGKNLIQHLVTSNPSPSYVSNVAAAFNSGSFTDSVSGQTFSGNTGRGDMQAVIAAILLDPEARNLSPDNNFGHLREPVLFITNTLRATVPNYAAMSYATDYVLGDSFLPSNVRMDQDVFRSPTVFNYYPPDNQMPCPSAPNCPLGPEFAIQSTSTALARINFMFYVAYGRMPTSADRPYGTFIDTTPFEPEAGGDGTALLADLNNRLMHGAMSTALQNIVLNAVQAIDPADVTARVQEAIYLIATSAEYQVER